ncbi:hypothetical protein JTB14_003266 [Gonioctena quinquepunctata]|nr:hypothetical protein JTB14_003266 [Gonioctena quinquepunctata]
MEDFENTSILPNFENETTYNIHEWVKELQLETCALIAIGLKYFAIFVEDFGKSNSTKYFLGVCHQTILEDWIFCSESLSKKRKHKCRFNLGIGRYHARVHRRFCDIKIMLRNRDCLCDRTIFGDGMYKVEGFPTCYIPPLPSSLCKYNVCGVSGCTAESVENRVHTVECDPECRGRNPFCEETMDRSARKPAVKSLWSKWRVIEQGNSGNSIAEERSVASCLNTHTGKGDLDCLGPGYACCPTNSENCSCWTYEESGVLKVERIIHQNVEGQKESKNHKRGDYRYQRDSDDDIEDDENEDDIDEDIVLIETSEEEISLPTTFETEKEELFDEFQKDTEIEIQLISKNITANNTESSEKGRSGIRRMYSGGVLVAMIYVLSINILE